MTVSSRAPQSSAVASLVSAEGTLTISVLDYEFPSTTTGFDADWLLVRVEWISNGGCVRCEGPILLAEELNGLGAWLQVTGEGASLAFTEPNLFIAWTRPTRSHKHVVSVELLCESASGNSSASAKLRVSRRGLAQFGRAIQAIARAFPSRAEREEGKRALTDLAAARARLAECEQRAQRWVA